MKLQKMAGSLILGAMISFNTACSNANPEKAPEKEAGSVATASEVPQQAAPKVAVLDAPQFAEKIKENGVQLVDVRTAGEVASGKIANAVNIDFNSVEFEAIAAKLDPAKPVAVYCKVGGRSSRAVKVFQELGFTEIYELDGGVIAWNASRLPLEK